MQLGILNFLLGFQPEPFTQGQGQQGATDLFSQLLSDSDPQSGGESFSNGMELYTDVAPNALLAQEVDTGKDVIDAADLADLMGHEITPDEAAALLEQLENLNANAEGETPLPPHHLEQLKTALTTIKETQKPQTVGEMIAHLPTLPVAGERPVIQRMLAWVKQTIATSKPKDSPTQEAAVVNVEDSAASPITQSLQASLFRDEPAQDQTAEETSAPREYVEIVPLSNTASVNEPAWIKQITTPAVRADIDEAIPSLTLPKEAMELPEVNLPGSEWKQTAQAPVEPLRPLPEAMAQIASREPVTDMVEAPTPTTHATSTPHAHSTEHKAAVMATPHVFNRAPVTEQVHVAIHRASENGIDALTIQLEPADLGRVEVKMHTSHEGQTYLTFLVDKAETLDALSRDARALERSLQEAGVKADTGSMQFNLRQQPQFTDANGDSNSHRGPHWDDENEQNGTVVGPQANAAITRNYTIALHDGVDIRA